MGSRRIDPSPSAVSMAGPNGCTEPGLSTDQGSVGASVDQVAVRSAPLRPSTRDKEALRHRVEKEHRLLKPPKSQHWVWKFLVVCKKKDEHT